MLAAAVLLGTAAVPAHATGDDGGKGAASATVLRTALDVGLLDKTARVPLEATLNEVHTGDGGGTARKTALTARLDGVENGEPFPVLTARVADAEAGRKENRSWGEVTLADAKVHVPGLPRLSVVELEQVTSRVECVTGRKPQARANVLGTVKVLGERVTLSAGGPTVVEVPQVGQVRIELSGTETTSDTAAASALDLTVSVDPLNLGVAEVQGTVTVAKATCEAPSQGEVTTQTVTSPSPSAVPQEPEATETRLAETGGSSATPYVAGGAAVLLVAGGALAHLTRRRVHRS